MRIGPSTCGRSPTLLRERTADIGQLWPRESGALHGLAEPFTERAAAEFEYYAGLADTYPFEEPAQPSAGEFGLLVREPVGVVGAIIAWNAPVVSISHKVAPALLCGCTVILKSPPEAPGEGLIAAEIAEEIGLPPGVLNVVTAEREVSELLVRDPRVDKISFTGSTATGRRIGALCGERIARCSLELGGKSAAVILDDADLELSRRDAGPRGVLDNRADLLLADSDRGHPQPSRRVRRRPRRGLLTGDSRGPVRPR